MLILVIRASFPRVFHNCQPELAATGGSISRRSQALWIGLFPYRLCHWPVHEITSRTIFKQPCHDIGSTGHADCGRVVVPIKDQSGLPNAINVGRLDIGIPVTAQSVVSLVISEKKNNVGPIFGASDQGNKDSHDAEEPPKKNHFSGHHNHKQKGWFQEGDKPNFVYPDKSGERIIYLSGPTRNHDRAGSSEVPYLALHPMGFTVPRGLLLERWALTPPFHPYQAEARRSVFCCTGRQYDFASIPPACTTVQKQYYAASRPVEFGLSSPGS